jgi:hypothetical protein
MKRRFLLLAGVSAAGSAWPQMPRIEDLMKEAGRLSKAPTAGAVGAGDDKTNVAGIQEALAVSTERAVASLGRQDGYFGNAAVKILMPSSIQKVADVARMAGYQKQVDEFVLSMNRAAEAAAPLASRHFGDAIRAMSVDDVRGILTGGDTAATEFFRARTHDKLYTAFKPVVSRSVSRVGATNAYKNMMGPYESLPMVRSQSLDLDDHVTHKSLDGLFHMVGEKEKKIRTNPAARTTDLLKAVFGQSARSPGSGSKQPLATAPARRAVRAGHRGAGLRASWGSCRLRRAGASPRAGFAMASRKPTFDLAR